MRRLAKIIKGLDARAWRALAISFVLFGGVGLIAMFGASLLGIRSIGAAQAWIGSGPRGPWGLPATVVGFTLLAFLGVPQFVLVAAAVVALGPWIAFVYSWTGNLVAAVLGFYVGRRFGSGVLRDHAGARVNRLVELIGRNGFWASVIVRLIPTAPFIVVNMAAGATPMRALAFVAGTAVGSVPKIALAAFAGDAALKAVNGGGTSPWFSLAVAGFVLLAAAVAARIWMRRKADLGEDAARDEDQSGEVSGPDLRRL